MTTETINQSSLTDEEMQEMLDTLTPEERKHYVQVRSVDAWRNLHRRGTVEAATGIGKTKIGIEAVVEQFVIDPESLVYIVVPTIELRDKDWPDEFKKWGYEHLIKKVKLICYSALHKQQPAKDVDLTIFDEIHHYTILGSAFNQPTNTWKLYNVLGLTAKLPNPEKNEEERIKRHLIDKIAPSCFHVPLEHAIKLELVADFEVKILRCQLDTTHQNILAGSKDKTFMTTEYAYYKFLTKMIQRMIMAKKDGAKFAWIGKRTRFLSNLASKKRLAKECMQGMIKAVNRTLIFGGSIDQVEELCNGYTYHSKTTDTQLQAFQAKEINYLGVVNALNEGKNIVDLDQILVIQLNSSELNIIQRIGRTIRFRKGHKALVVVLVAAGTADEQWCDNAFENFDKSRITYYNVSVPDIA